MSDEHGDGVLLREISDCDLISRNGDCGTYLWVDAGETVEESLDGAVWGGTAVPSLRWPSLWDILEVASVFVEPCSNDVGDGFVVGNTSGAVCAVREVFGVEVEGDDADDGWEREVVDVWVVLLGESAVLAIAVMMLVLSCWKWMLGG